MSTDDLSRNIDAYERNRKLLNEGRWGWSSVDDGKRIGQTIEEILRNSSESASTESLERLVALRDVVVHDRVEESRNIYDDYEEHLVKGGVYSAGEIRRLADCELKRRGLVLHEGKARTPDDLQKHLSFEQEVREWDAPCLTIPSRPKFRFFRLRQQIGQIVCQARPADSGA